MLNSDDLYVQSHQEVLSAASGSSPAYGATIMHYEVRQFVDVRNPRPPGANPGLLKPSYLVTCTHRLIFPNQTPFVLLPSGGPPADSKLSSGYGDYPALVVNTITPQGSSDSNIRLVKYSPRTLNASVGKSTSQVSATSSGTTRERTSGSSVSDTSSYNVSLQAGIGIVGGPTITSGSSTTNSAYGSLSAGGSSGASRDVTVGDSLSIKDWAAYVQLSAPVPSAPPTIPTWAWGQEYPWDAVQFRPEKPDPDPGGPYPVDLPAETLAALFASGQGTSTVIYPPSHLSLFGVDVTMQATWLVDLPSNLTEQTLNIAHEISYAQASHGLVTNGATPSQIVQQQPIALAGVQPATLDLTLLGLDPIRNGSSGNGAVIGLFAPEKFVVSPDKDTTGKGQFKILSDANTLQVTGSGFDTAMTTTFTKTPGQATVSLDFKVVDTDVQYALFLKHWVLPQAAGENGSTLAITVNGLETITRHVDSLEGEGGDNNLTTVALRNLNYASINYHDYLQLGHNHIDITITPDEPKAAGYVLRAVAIGED